MTIDEAIEELKGWNSKTFEVSFVSFSEAIKLGIEALIRIRSLRNIGYFAPAISLPGETKD